MLQGVDTATRMYISPGMPACIIGKPHACAGEVWYGGHVAIQQVAIKTVTLTNHRQHFFSMLQRITITDY